MSFEWIEHSVFASWWLQWEDLEWPDPALEKKWHARAEQFAASGINTVIIFGFHFRWDYVPILQRVLKILGKISSICHEKGLRVVDHHSALFVHRVRNEQDRWHIRNTNRHHVPFYTDSWDYMLFGGHRMEDWVQISARDLRSIYFENYRCQVFCPNQPDYQESYKTLVERHWEHMEFDALMSDDLEYVPDEYSCACEHCQRRFKEETGLDLLDSEENILIDHNPQIFQKWLQRRKVWLADHYKRTREALPASVALWGCASSCMHPNLAKYGFSVQQYAKYWDAVFLEIYHKFQLTDETRKDITAELCGFKSIARHFGKPVIALFYANKPEDIPGWMDYLERWNIRPWISKQVRTEQAAPEEELLKEKVVFNPRETTKPSAAVEYSEQYCDNLSAGLREKYYRALIELANRLVDEGYQVTVQFDEVRDDAIETKEKWLLQEKNGEFLPVKQNS